MLPGLTSYPKPERFRINVETSLEYRRRRSARVRRKWLYVALALSPWAFWAGFELGEGVSRLMW